MTFISYQFKKFFRSYTFIPPYSVYILWIFILYVYKNQMILSSYASASTLLFFVTAWLTIKIFQLESITEEHLLFIQMHSRLKYLNNKMYFVFLTTIPLITISFLYPILTVRFAETLSLQSLLLGIYMHIIVVVIGIIIGTFIVTQNFLSRKYSWLLLTLILVISLLRFTLIHQYPLLKILFVFIPPVGDFLTFFTNSHLTIISYSFLIINAEMIIYIAVSTIIINYIFKKKIFINSYLCNIHSVYFL